jgi:hypothetical protein
LQSLSAISSDLQTSLAGMLQLLIAHGPSFLRQEELEKLLRLHISLYYRFLGKSLLLGHHEKLAYHKKKLMDAGVGFSWTRVVLGLLSGLRDLALNPKSSTQKLLKRSDARGHIDREKDLVAGPAARTLQGEL